MAKAGRKRIQGKPRTKSGAISRAGQDPRMVALAQHHRAGRLSEWRGTTVGRLLEDDTTHTKGLSRDALHRAAVRLSEMHAAWQAAIATAIREAEDVAYERACREIALTTIANIEGGSLDFINGLELAGERIRSLKSQEP